MNNKKIIKTTDSSKATNIENKTDKIIIKILSWLIFLILAVAVALLVKYYIITPRIVEQESMLPTLQPGQRLILDRWFVTQNKDYTRGMIVTFEAPSIMNFNEKIDYSNPVAIYNKTNYSFFDGFIHYVLEAEKTTYIKRIIGLPGEHVNISNGKVYINGNLLNEPYLTPGTETLATGYTFSDVIVPAGYVFVMGDNRTKSADSRNFGCIPISRLEGKIVFSFWPLNTWGNF
ncbi:MAG: signal peptidase I [Oscillospiraceae bacterium]|nr:signal peptidase I [Oscillospiraceae bacterium]